MALYLVSELDLETKLCSLDFEDIEGICQTEGYNLLSIFLNLYMLPNRNRRKRVKRASNYLI